jgi:uncharacterized protein YeaO (DUF488 family)
MVDRVRASNVKLKRAYEPGAKSDGWRVLIDRLWPRGVSKAEAALDAWDKDVAPSSALRQWFGHDPARWAVFRRRYADELRAMPGPVRRLRSKARAGPITLVYAAHDQHHTHAIVLRDILLGRPIPPSRASDAAEADPVRPRPTENL